MSHSLTNPPILCGLHFGIAAKDGLVIMLSLAIQSLGHRHLYVTQYTKKGISGQMYKLWLSHLVYKNLGSRKVLSM